MGEPIDSVYSQDHARRDQAPGPRRRGQARLGDGGGARAELRAALGQPSPGPAGGGDRHQAGPAGRARHPADRRRAAAGRAGGRGHRPPRRGRERAGGLRRAAGRTAPAGGVPLGPRHHRADGGGDPARPASRLRPAADRGRAAGGAANAAGRVRGRRADLPARGRRWRHPPGDGARAGRGAGRFASGRPGAGPGGGRPAPCWHWGGGAPPPPPPRPPPPPPPRPRRAARAGPGERVFLPEPVHLIMPDTAVCGGEPPLASAVTELWPADLARLSDQRWIAGCDRCREHLLRQCAQAGFTPRISFTTDDFVAAQALVTAGLGVTLLPGLALRAARNPGVRTARLRGTRRCVVAVRYGEPPAPPATAVLLDALRVAAAGAPSGVEAPSTEPVSVA